MMYGQRISGRSAVPRVSVEVRRLRAEQIEKSRLCNASRWLEPHKVIGIGLTLTFAVRVTVGMKVSWWHGNDYHPNKDRSSTGQGGDTGFPLSEGSASASLMHL